MSVNKIELNPKITFEKNFQVSNEEMLKTGEVIKVSLLIFIAFSSSLPFS